MSAAAGPYGFIPVKHPSGQNRGESYAIQNNAGTGYATSIFRNDMVILNTAGYVTIGTAAADLLGSFQGCEYQDASGATHVSNFWPASVLLFNTSVAPIAWIVTDPATVYSCQSSGSVAATAVGDQSDLIATAGSTITGCSAQSLNVTLVGAGVSGQFRYIGLDGDLNNAWGDGFTKVLVQLARSQFVSAKVAI